MHVFTDYIVPLQIEVFSKLEDKHYVICNSKYAIHFQAILSSIPYRLVFNRTYIRVYMNMNFLPDIPHFCWSPLFWTDRHTGLSFRVKSLHNSLKCFLILVFWYLSPTLCLEHAASSLYLEFSGLTGPKPQTEPWVSLLQVIQGPYFENK